MYCKKRRCLQGAINVSFPNFNQRPVVAGALFTFECKLKTKKEIETAMNGTVISLYLSKKWSYYPELDYKYKPIPFLLYIKRKSCIYKPCGSRALWPHASFFSSNSNERDMPPGLYVNCKACDGSTFCLQESPWPTFIVFNYVFREFWYHSLWCCFSDLWALAV